MRPLCAWTGLVTDAALRTGVNHVIGLSTDEQVSRIDARRIITPVHAVVG